MKNRVFKAEYAGHPVYYEFLNTDAAYYFGKHLKAVKEIQNPDIKVSESLIDKVRPLYPPGTKESYMEYKLMIQQTGKYLLRYKCSIFHCVSFVYKDYTWLLTAPSGTGKSTQYFNWQRLFPGEIKMISGDMPVLELRDDQTIHVHPTSWNGKENIGNQITAPLGGVILLEQGHTNHISALSVKDALLPIFSQFMAIPENKEEVHSLSLIMDSMFKDYPVMKLINQGNDESTILLRDRINMIIKERYEV